MARVVSTAGSPYPQAGVMIRESLGTDSANHWCKLVVGSFASGTGPRPVETHRTKRVVANAAVLVKLVRSGNNSRLTSANGMTWTQNRNNQTITMAQNVYIGLVSVAMSIRPLPRLLSTTFQLVPLRRLRQPLRISATTGSWVARLKLVEPASGPRKERVWYR